jgi:hypothetical protein
MNEDDIPTLARAARVRKRRVLMALALTLGATTSGALLQTGQHGTGLALAVCVLLAGISAPLFTEEKV